MSLLGIVPFSLLIMIPVPCCINSDLFLIPYLIRLCGTNNKRKLCNQWRPQQHFVLFLLPCSTHLASWHLIAILVFLGYLPWSFGLEVFSYSFRDIRISTRQRNCASAILTSQHETSITERRAPTPTT